MKLLKRKINHDYYKIIALVALLFFIGVNIAWLNPGPRVAKTNPKIPIYWQYDCDASVDFLSGAFFPKYFKVDPQRINRPTFPFLAKILAEFIGLLVWPFFKMNILLKALIGYALLKLFYYLCGALMLYWLVRERFGRQVALLSVIVTFFHPHSIRWVATFATAPAQFITPIIVVFLFDNWLKNQTCKRNIIYSAITAVLLLVKENYAVYLTILFFGLWKKRFKAVGASVVGFLIPQALWFLTLKLYHIPYHNEQLGANNKMVTWIFSDLLHRHPIIILQTIMASIADWLAMYAKFYFFFAALALLAFVYKLVRKKLNQSVRQFLLFFLFFSWAQTLAINLYDRPFRVADLSLVIFPLGVFTAVQLINHNFGKPRAKKIIVSGIVFYILLSLVSFIGLPWIHPYNQLNVLEYKQKKINTFRQGEIYQGPQIKNSSLGE